MLLNCGVGEDSWESLGLQGDPISPSPTPRVYSNSYPLSWWVIRLLSPSPPAFSLSQHQGLLKWVSSLHQMAKVLEFQLQHQSFQWIFRTNFFRMDWLDLLVVEGTLKSPLQHHSSKVSILWHSAFFIVQLSHQHMTTGKKHSCGYMDLCWQSNASAF